MRVRLNNVGIVKECDIEFVPGINLIIGSSGSGKSTLMRCLYNMAVNEFSDSDISFGQNTMNVRIENGGNTIEYSRSIKAKGERCYYKVNGETYVKLGRQALPAVSETLRIGDVNVNGEDVNFNFNLQFSSPFLILGNQATLYNVLTYRSSFDISSINDYYSADIKSNASEIAANEKLKARLESNLESLEEQAYKLSPIENLYGDYIAYKHKAELLGELKLLYDKMAQDRSLEKKIITLDNIIISTTAAITTASILKELYKYRTQYVMYDDVKLKSKQYTNIVSSYEKSMRLIQSLLMIKKLHSLKQQHESVYNNIEIIDMCLTSTNNTLKNETLVNDLVKQSLLVNALRKCCAITDILNKTDDGIITQINDLMYVAEKLTSLSDINTAIKNVKRKCTMTHNKMAKFGICPLCGNHLEIHEESIDE